MSMFTMLWDVDTLYRYQGNIEYRRDRVVESLANVYKVGWSFFDI